LCRELFARQKRFKHTSGNMKKVPHTLIKLGFLANQNAFSLQ